VTAEPEGTPAGSGREAEQPAARFYYDFSSPYSYLAAERIAPVFAEAGAEQPEWVPISFGHVLKTTGRTPWSMQPGGANPADLAEIQERAAARGLPEVVYSEGWPLDNYSILPTRAATFAKQSGKTVSFSQAAFRQHFAAGRDLSEIDNVLIAAAACELHPNAVIKGVETESVKAQLREATDAAIEKGVEGIPTVDVGGELFWGDDQLEIAAAKAASRAE
jgi:2-hydroxychromene-2-carboxylate isomerase